MEGRGFNVSTAESVSDGLTQVERAAPAFAVVDMRLGDGNGLDVISALKRRRPDARGIILTGYGNIATAVNAVKLGAVDYLAKPADADDVVAALLAVEGKKPEPPEHPMSADRVRWEHIQRIYELCGRNVSETARQLNMQRRALRDAQHHRLARRRGELVLRRFAHDLAAESVGDDQARVLRKNLARHVERGGKEQPVAMRAIFHPFVVGAEIGDRGLDLHDPDFTRRVERDEIGSAAGREQQFADAAEAVRQQKPHGAARHRQRRFRLAAVDREFCNAGDQIAHSAACLVPLREA
jgi:two-component system, response regulator RegA